MFAQNIHAGLDLALLLRMEAGLKAGLESHGYKSGTQARPMHPYDYFSIYILIKRRQYNAWIKVGLIIVIMYLVRHEIKFAPLKNESRNRIH